MRCGIRSIGCIGCTGGDGVSGSSNSLRGGEGVEASVSVLVSAMIDKGLSTFIRNMSGEFTFPAGEYVIPMNNLFVCFCIETPTLMALILYHTS